MSYAPCCPPLLALLGVAVYSGYQVRCLCVDNYKCILCAILHKLTSVLSKSVYTRQYRVPLYLLFIHLWLDKSI